MTGTFHLRPWLAPLLLALFAALLLVIDRVGSSYLQRIVILVGINTVLVVALNLSNGFAGVFSLGHIGFMAIGAYTSALLTLPLALKVTNLPDLPPWLASSELPFLAATLIAGLVALVVALFVGFSLMRLSGPYVSVATLGFLMVVQVVLVNWETLTRGARTFSGLPAFTNLWWAWGWAALTVYLVWRVKRSAFGRNMFAGRDNARAARVLGISILRSRLLAFCLSAFLTGVAGALWAHFILAFSPKSFSFAMTFQVITMLVVGGTGSVTGSVVGAAFFTVLSELLRNAEGGLDLGFLQIPPLYGVSQVIMATLFILVIIFRPKGLFGDRELTWPTWPSRRRKSKEPEEGSSP